MKNLFFIVAILFAIQSLHAQWEPDQRLTYDPSASQTPMCSGVHAIASTGDTIHLVWFDNRDGNDEIYYIRSLDGGLTWGEEIRLTYGMSSSRFPTIAVSGLNVYVAWIYDLEYEVYFKRSTDGGNTWSEDTRLTYTPDYTWHPCLAVSGANIHLVYYDYYYGWWEVYYKHSSDGGLTWEPDVRLTDNFEGSYWATISASGPILHVAWYDLRDGNREIYYKRSTDNGISWGEDTRLTFDESTSWYPTIAVSESYVYLVWEDLRDGIPELYFTRSTDGGLNWDPDYRLTSNSGLSEYPNIVSSGTNIFVVWVDDTDGNKEIYYKHSTDAGLNWSPDTRLTNDPAESNNAFISTSNSKLHVVWFDERDGNYEIYYKRNPTGSIIGGIDEKLYYLSKTWGYLKYFSQNKCDIKWDTLLNTTINEVLLSTSNEDFNNAMMNMFNKVGNNSFVQNPGTLPDTNINFDNSWIDDPIFSQPVRNFLDTFSIHIYPDESECLVKFGNSSFIDFSGDPLSLPVDFYDEAYRLTYMFYYWNVINYFFPYKNLMDQDWDSTLYQFISKFRQVETIPEFHITFLQLVTKINDTHGYTASSFLNTYFWGGTNMPKIYFTRVDTNCVVTKVDGITGISPGDILTGLNGIPIREIDDSLVEYIPASTPAAYYYELYYKMLWGQYNTNISLNLSDANNNPYTVEVSRNISYSSWDSWAQDPGLTSSWFETTCGYGYVNVGMLMPNEVSDMYNGLKDAPAIIFDIRNYPYVDLSDIAQLVFPEPVTSAIMYYPALSQSDPYYYYPGWYYILNDSDNLGNWSNPDAYEGNIYILVNEVSQSAAEYTCQYLSYHPNARVFGTQTAGADGSVSYLSLPGGITTYFTSLGWYYADGYQQQRNGVKIDSIVAPTIDGIRHGKDEILDAALDCLNIEETQLINNDALVFPNPVSGQEVNIELTLEANADFTVSLYNLTGEIIFQQSKNGIQGVNILNLKLPHVSAGLYFLQVKHENQRLNTKLVVK